MVKVESKRRSMFRLPVWNGPDYSAVIRSEPVIWGYTCTERLFPDIQLANSGCSSNFETPWRAKYERLKVNGQKLVWSTVKPPKRAGLRS